MPGARPAAGSSLARGTGRWRRFGWPRRTIRPTRDGWWLLFAALGLGVAALNTGNNLLYLLCSMLLALVVVSGLFSEQTMRGLRVEGLLPDEIYAGRPAVMGAAVVNTKRWLASYSLAVEVRDPVRPVSFHLPRMGPGERRLVTWQCVVEARGRHRLPGVRIATRFPFGLFSKISRLLLAEEVVVFPAVRPLARLRPDTRAAAGSGARRRGRGHELHRLREYRPGDDHRLIHWRSTARAQVLITRELEAEAALDTCIRLVGTGRSDPARLEAALSDAASLGVHLLRAGAAVEVVGPGLLVAAGRGREHERLLLTALALYCPPVAGDPDRTAREGAPSRREVRVDLG